MPLLFSAPAAALRPARWLQCGVARFCATPVVAARRTRTETPSAPAAAIEAKATKKSSKAAEKPSKADVNKPAVHKLIQDDFLPAAKAKQLRADYDRRFATPRKTETRAFMFDYWYVENQYNLLRAPASEFFPPKTYKLIEEALLEFGQSRLGCRSLTPVWLSLYIGGCRQDFHMDNANHGPWAFVYSITNWDERKFSGGETMILQKDMLSFWQNYEREKVVERDQILDFVEPRRGAVCFCPPLPSRPAPPPPLPTSQGCRPRFNRLTCFDPRFPHGVRQVEGTINPMDARVVLHGWFTGPPSQILGSRLGPRS
eukprot:tig00000404_g407.t1